MYVLVQCLMCHVHIAHASFFTVIVLVLLHVVSVIKLVVLTPEMPSGHRSKEDPDLLGLETELCCLL